jgi:hypothetical protein
MERVWSQKNLPDVQRRIKTFNLKFSTNCQTIFLQSDFLEDSFFRVISIESMHFEVSLLTKVESR